MKKIGKGRIVASLLLAVLFVFITITNIGGFSNQYDSLVGFLPENHSRVITAQTPAQIKLSITNSHFDYGYMVFTPESESAEGTTMKISMSDENGNVIFSEKYQGGNLFMSKYININPETDPVKGSQCTITIESDAQNAESGYRMLLGRVVKSEISSWQVGDIVDNSGLQPELHLVYPQHFGTNTFIVYCLCLLAIVLLPLIPKFKFEEKLNFLVAFAAVPVSSAITLYFIELLSNNSVRYIPFRVLLCNFLIIMGAQLLLAALTGRVHLAVILTVVFGFVAGTINHFVLMFRGTAVVPIDVIAAGAARDVISNYSFAPDIQILLAAAVLGAGCVLVARYPVKLEIKKLWHNIARVACGLLACCVLVFSCSKYSRQWSGAYMYFKDATVFARMNGFVYSFVQTIHNMVMEEPAGYDADYVKGVMAEVEIDEKQTDVQPDIIIIMSETWADLSMITDVSSFSTDPMPYLHSVAKDDNPNTMVGSTIVPVFGSGTCNSEFESITGLSLANFSTYCFPYLQFVDDSTPSVASFLKDSGYRTYALHPGETETWARDRVYKYFNFDEIYFWENFPYQDLRHEMVSDGACFNSILDLLPTEDGEQPAFIFNVTIRNHGGYSKNTDFDIRVKVENTDGKFDDAERFASLMLYSDEELEQFIKQLEQRERPTVLVMFGDHLPSLNEDYFRYIHMDQAEAANPLARYTTPYFIWSNYDIDTSAIPQTVSSNFIGLMAMKLADVQLNGWFSYLDGQMAKTPVYSLYGIKDADGNFVDIGRYDYQHVQYTMFRKTNIVPEEFYKFK